LKFELKLFTLKRLQVNSSFAAATLPIVPPIVAQPPQLLTYRKRSATINRTFQ
jgi:hypothetical protein